MEDGTLLQKLKKTFQIEEEFDEAMQKQAGKLIRNVFRYMDKDAKDIMTHRKQILCINEQETLEDALKYMIAERHTRFPVYRDDIDQITGILHLRNAISYYMEEKNREKKLADLPKCIRPASFIPETKSIDTLFRSMQAKKIHLVIVLDEYGQTSGIVSIEDIIEEIVGNIFDEHEEEEILFKANGDGTYTADGFIDLEELEDQLPIHFDKDEFETLNGFLINQLEHIPSEEEKAVIQYGGYKFTIQLVNNNTIKRVKIEKCAH